MTRNTCLSALLVFSFFSFCSGVFAQSGRDLIGLENGDEISAGKVRMRSPMFGKIFIEADGDKRFSFEEVAYFENEDGFFEKLIPPMMNEPVFLKRELHGPNISAYSHVSTYTSYQPAGPGMMGAPVMHRARLDYYSKDPGVLKNMTFSNLRMDLGDNARSAEMLKKVKGLRVATGLLYVAGAGMVIAGISSSLNNQSDDPTKDSGISPLFIAGAVSLAIPWVIFRPIKREKMLDAVRLYNH